MPSRIRTKGWVYEWRIKVGDHTQLQAGLILGFNIGVALSDDDWDPSYLIWGGEEYYGDLLLVESNVPSGRLTGSVVWDETGELVHQMFVYVITEMKDQWLRVQTDAKGSLRFGTANR